MNNNPNHPGNWRRWKRMNYTTHFCHQPGDTSNVGDDSTYYSNLYDQFKDSERWIMENIPDVNKPKPKKKFAGVVQSLNISILEDETISTVACSADKVEAKKTSKLTNISDRALEKSGRPILKRPDKSNIYQRADMVSQSASSPTAALKERSMKRDNVPKVPKNIFVPDFKKPIANPVPEIPARSNFNPRGAEKLSTNDLNSMASYWDFVIKLNDFIIKRFSKYVSKVKSKKSIPNSKKPYDRPIQKKSEKSDLISQDVSSISSIAAYKANLIKTIKMLTKRNRAANLAKTLSNVDDAQNVLKNLFVSWKSSANSVQEIPASSGVDDALNIPMKNIFVPGKLIAHPVQEMPARSDVGNASKVPKNIFVPWKSNAHPAQEKLAMLYFHPKSARKISHGTSSSPAENNDVSTRSMDNFHF